MCSVFVLCTEGYEMSDYSLEFLLTLSVIANFLMAGHTTWLQHLVRNHAEHIEALYAELEKE